MSFRLRTWRRGKEKRAGKERDGDSIASGASRTSGNPEQRGGAQGANLVLLTRTQTYTHTHEHAHTVEGGYVVEKVKDLPRLHRSVWKGNLVKVKRLTKSMKNSELNSVDKEKR